MRPHLDGRIRFARRGRGCNDRRDMVSANKLGFGWRGAALLALCGWLGAGCRSAHGPNPESMASVIVTGRTVLETAHAVSEVFQAAGYQPVPQHQNNEFRLVFDIVGSGADTVLYGDFVGEKVWYRAKVHLTTMGADSVLVSCDGFRVLDHGDGHFESEHKLSRGGRYQELLERIRAHLK